MSPRSDNTVSRRRLLGWAVRGTAAATLWSLGLDSLHKATDRGIAAQDSTGSTVTAQAGRGTGQRVLYRDAAIADGRSKRLRRGVSVLVEDGRIAWIRPTDGEEDPGPREGLRVIDASGATMVPGMVDSHSHVTLPGGANYLDRATDPAGRMLRVAEDNGRLAMRAGIRWFRDVGSPTVEDPRDGRRRALALGVRDRWSERDDRPRVRSAGTWLVPPGVLRSGLGIVVPNGAALTSAAMRQLDQGADLIKLYVQSSDPDVSPWSVSEIATLVRAVHRRGAKVTAHVQRAGPADVAVRGGVDALEHGFRLEPSTAREMVRRKTFLVSTLTVPRSFLALGKVSGDTPWSSGSGRAGARALLRDAEASVRAARRAGVRIAAGTDFGGGSSRANQLAWEVQSLVRAGLQPHEALAAATWRGGQLLGERDAGRIREGGPADFFLVHGDPLVEPAALWRVWLHA